MLINMLKKGDWVEFCFTNTQIIEGSFVCVEEDNYVLTDQNGATFIIPSDKNNILYIKIVCLNTSGEEPVVLSNIPSSRQNAMEMIKNKYRKNSNFSVVSSQTYKPKLESE
jgi:hypothetical protein